MNEPRPTKRAGHGSIRALGACLVAVGLAAASATSQAPVGFANLALAGTVVDYTAVQLRRFPDPKGGVVTVRERLEVDANGTSHPAFAVTFLGVEGELPGSPQHVEMQNTYARFGSLFFTHGTFQVRDLAAANQNYTLYDFGPVTRAGRSAQRLVVFPSTIDKAMWVIDVDAQTRVALYTAEFDSHLTVITEVEAISFTTTVGTIPPAPSTTLHANYQAAKSAMGNPAELIDPLTTSAAEYGIQKIEVQDDPLNGRQKLMMTYSDGIDQFVVVQVPGTRDHLAGIPGVTRNGHAIARFRDPAMSALLFWEGGVSFHVAGRGAMQRLDEVARNLFVQALSTH